MATPSDPAPMPRVKAEPGAPVEAGPMPPVKAEPGPRVKAEPGSPRRRRRRTGRGDAKPRVNTDTFTALVDRLVRDRAWIGAATGCDDGADAARAAVHRAHRLYDAWIGGELAAGTLPSIRATLAGAMDAAELAVRAAADAMPALPDGVVDEYERLALRHAMAVAAAAPADCEKQTGAASPVADR